MLSLWMIQSHLKKEAIEVAENVLKGNIDVNTAINQLFQKVQQKLGSNAHILNNVQPLIQQLLNAVPTLFPSLASNFGQRGGIVA